MTRADAQRVLATWRPDRPPSDDPAVQDALDRLLRDPESAAWLAAHVRFQESVRDALHAVPVPPDLAERILAARKTVRPDFTARRRLVLGLAAAAVILMLGMVAALWPARNRPAEFATFRSRVVRGVQREYRMDVVTNDLAAIRGFMASRQAPSDFVLPPRLAAEPAVGGGLVSWQGGRASMICLGGGARGMLYLFVLPTDEAGAGAPLEPEGRLVGKLPTLAWSAGGRTYLLASDHLTLEQLRAYL